MIPTEFEYVAPESLDDALSSLRSVGEAATIACSPAVVSSVLDALRPLGVTEIDMPLTPMRVWDAIQAANGGAS